MASFEKYQVLYVAWDAYYASYRTAKTPKPEFLNASSRCVYVTPTHCGVKYASVEGYNVTAHVPRIMLSDKPFSAFRAFILYIFAVLGVI